MSGSSVDVEYFTFHNVSINTIFDFFVLMQPRIPLHSTMFLLILNTDNGLCDS